MVSNATLALRVPNEHGDPSISPSPPSESPSPESREINAPLLFTETSMTSLPSKNPAGTRRRKASCPPYIYTTKAMLEMALRGRSLKIIQDWEDFELSDNVAVVVSVYYEKFVIYLLNFVLDREEY